MSIRPILYLQCSSTLSVRDDVYMRDYFPQALDFLPGDRFDTQEAKEKWEPYEFSEKFDFESIMLYDSTAGAATGKYVITKQPDKTPLWMGGSKDTNEYSISEAWLQIPEKRNNIYSRRC